MLTNSSQGSYGNQSTVELFDNVDDKQKHEAMPWDNSDPFISAYARDVIQKVLKCYVRQMIVFVGIPGNIISCAVFLKQGLSDRINLLLFWLAVADLTNLATQIVLMPGCYLEDRIQIANWNTIVNTNVVFISMWSGYASGTLIVVVSLDRCLSVALPFRAKTLLTYRATMTAILLSYVMPLVLLLPCFFAFTVSWRVDPSTNRSIAYMEDTHWFPVDGRVAVDIGHGFGLIARPVFLIVMVTCCIITVAKLHQAAVKRGQILASITEEGNAGDNRITNMLLLLCFIYIILVIPQTCNGLAVRFVPEYYLYTKYHNTFVVVFQFLWIASCLNSAVNFYAYLLLSSRFQRTLKETCHCFGHNLSKKT